MPTNLTIFGPSTNVFTFKQTSGENSLFHSFFQYYSCIYVEWYFHNLSQILLPGNIRPKYYLLSTLEQYDTLDCIKLLTDDFVF